MRSFSEGLYLAVTCHDYPQLWDPAAPAAVRREQLARTVAALPPEPFAPISPTVWTSLDYEGAIACLNWPGPQRPDPPVPPDATYPAVPTLVLNGDLDNITASSGARVVASRFPRATFVEIANTVHVSAIGDRDGCAAPLVRRFIRRLAAGDTSCAARVAEVRAVDRFPRTAAGAVPADPRAGDRSTPAQRRAAAVAAATVADAIQRWVLNTSGAAAACAAGAGATPARGWCASASAGRASRATSRSAGPRPGGSPTAQSAPACASPAAGACASAGAPGARSRSRRSTARSAAAGCARRCSLPEAAAQRGRVWVRVP